MSDETPPDTQATGMPSELSPLPGGISPAEMDLKGSNPIDPAAEDLKANDTTPPTDDALARNLEFGNQATEFETLLRDTIKNEIVIVVKELGPGRGSANGVLQSQLHEWVKLGLELL